MRTNVTLQDLINSEAEKLAKLQNDLEAVKAKIKGRSIFNSWYQITVWRREKKGILAKINEKQSLLKLLKK